MEFMVPELHYDSREHMKVDVKIMYVEDESILASLVSESLVKQGYKVVQASNGEAGWNVFVQHQPDLCILDVMMPVMDGFTLAKKIRSMNSSVPIIFLTAKSTVNDVLEGFATGGNDYLKKPFSMQELIARVENMLTLTHQKEPTTADQHQIINFGDAQYNIWTQVLELNKEKSALSHREHELLMMLYDANKAIVDRKYILKKLWGDDSFFNSRNLDVYIRKLRRRFEKAENVQIITLKGVGYRFIF